MTTSESKGRFFYQTNRFESRIGMLYKEVQHVRFRCKRPVTVRRCAHGARLEFTAVEGVVASRRVKYRNKAKSAWTRIITGLI